jgi:hypothetical protein
MNRPPDLVIGHPGKPYLRRWDLLKFLGWQIALHEMLTDDDARALHDHPSFNISIVLRGGYVEYTQKFPEGIWQWPGSIIFRRAATLHRLELMRSDRPSWSIWIRGPKIREWGFQCLHRWVPWYEFVNANDPGQIGRGCD